MPETFGLYTVVRLLPFGWVEVACACGNRRTYELKVLQWRVKAGRTPNCGCARKASLRVRCTTHGAATGGLTPEYIAWHGAKGRCFNPDNTAYDRYGGRGITMAEEWRQDFPRFLADMGPRPSAEYSLDRYPDNDGPYAPGNCRWATRVEQANNRRPFKKQGPRVDLRGQVYGRLTALEYIDGKHWRCRCACGTEITVSRGNLRNGHTRSCGCLASESARETIKRNARHLTRPTARA